MKRIEIIVNGKAYPCSPTAGAMLRFKEQTAREVTEIDSSSFTRSADISVVLRGRCLEARGHRLRYVC